MSEPNVSIDALIASLTPPAAGFAGSGLGGPNGPWSTGSASNQWLLSLLLNRLQHERSRSQDSTSSSEDYRFIMASLPSAYDEHHRAHIPGVMQTGNYAPVTHMRAQAHSVQVNSHLDFDLLETYRSDVAALARFSQRVDHATWHLSIAIDTQVDNAHWPTPRVKVRRAARSWNSVLADQCFARWRATRDLLVHDWTVPDRSEPLYRIAFWSLCELTPADSQLKLLFEQDRMRACRELAKHVDAYADQLALATDLADTMAGEQSNSLTPQMRLTSIQAALLDKAGDRLSLTEAAERLGISRQALHKKIKTGAALGLMIGETFVVPGAQIVDGESGSAIITNLRDVISLFTEAGAGEWSALQYLIEPDPTLRGGLPLDQLKAGNVEAVVLSARAYLGLDER